MTLTINKNAARTLTAAAAMAEYMAETSEEQALLAAAIEAEYEEYMAELAAIEAEEAAWKANMAALDDAYQYGVETGDFSFYSDVFKDINGIRPRW